MKPIELEVFFYGEDSMKMIELGINDEIPISKCKLRKMLFLNISGIAPYIEDDEEYTAIHCNGTDFISPVKYEKLKSIIIYEKSQ